MISLPAVAADVEIEIPKLPESYTSKLFSKNRRLLLSANQVTLIENYTLSKKLIYDEPVVCATYTTFRSDREKQENDSDCPEALAVCLPKAAHIYYPDGQYYMVSFPFTLKNAFPFEFGLLLERDTDHQIQPGQHGAQFTAHRFLTLVDPIGDFRMVTTSSTSVVTSQENLVCFPAHGINKDRSLCATFNARQGVVSMYHIKVSLRNVVVGRSDRGSTKKRKNPSLSTPYPSKVLEDEILQDFHHPFSMLMSMSLNMEKKRTSTLLSGVSSIGRMGSETGFPDASRTSQHDLHALKKDMILTKIADFPFKCRRSKLLASLLSYLDQEAIVLCNMETQETQIHIFKLESGHGSISIDSFLQLQCAHAYPLQHPRFSGWLLVLKDEKTLQMFHPFLNITTPTINLASKFPPMKSISSSFSSLVALSSASGSHLVELILEPNNKLVSTCLQAWKYLCGSKIYEHIWILWRAALFLDERLDEWNAFVSMLLALVYPFEYEDFGSIQTENEITKLLPKAKELHDYFEFDYLFNDLIPYIVVALHLIYEDSQLDVLAQDNLSVLAHLLTQLIVWMGWLDHWASYYMVDHEHIDQTTRLLLVLLLYSPPSVFDCLTGILHTRRSRYLRFSQLVEEGNNVGAEITPRTCFVIAAFEAIVSKDPPTKLVKVLNEYSIAAGDLETFPLGVSVPIKECLVQCQQNPDLSWSPETLDLIGRPDLTALLEPGAPEVERREFSVDSDVGRDANAVLESLGLAPPPKDDEMAITKLIYDADRRFFEITSLLLHTKVQLATISIDEQLSEYDSTVLKREVAALVSLRTLTLPLGRAMLFHGSKRPLLTETFKIDDFNLNTLIAPSMTNIVFSEDSVSPAVMEWGHFHNGAAAGLSVSKQLKQITGSWVIFNKPQNNTAQHAGFLLGLGLSGHLRKLEEWHIYNYLGPKHPLTSVGLLIGMAASLRGTMDNKLTKVLSVHAVALLPLGANDLNVPILVQTAGLIGIGLLYLESQHRRMSDILFSQISGKVSHIENDEEQEGYRLAAGISLGLINLGKGDDLRGPGDTVVVETLLSIVTGLKDSQLDLESDKSGSAAVIALALIYLQTGNAGVAEKLQVPESEQLLDYVRPDCLLLRCMAKNVIMWEHIGKSVAWVEAEVPERLRAKHSLMDMHELDSDQVGFFSILGGACFALALKYASSQDLTARDTLLHYLDAMMALSTKPAVNYDQRISFSSVSQVQNLLAICVSMVMAGSGDLEVFRRLRVLHGRISKSLQYGNHIAASMALGFLFLGGGQYAFGKTKFALASLIVALYPVFPSGGGENEVHLEALRHFWCLAVEPRCLIVRDVKNGAPIRVPVKITLKNGQTVLARAPHLLCDLDQISVLEVAEPGFFKVKIDFLMPSAYLDLFKQSLTVYVLKKTNYELLQPSVLAILQSESRRLQMANGEISVDPVLEKFVNIHIKDRLLDHEKQVYLQESNERISENRLADSGLSFFDIIETKMELTRMASRPASVQELRSLKLLFAYGDLVDEFRYLSTSFVELLKHKLWETKAA